jgi:hypothetical protein
MQNSLTKLADKFGSDKGTLYEGHMYTGTYEKLFAPMKNEKINFLEIGIFDSRFPCASVKMWDAYFTNAEIYGIDFQSKAEIECKFAENIHIFIVNQAIRSEMEKFVHQAQVSFDVIVDDGSHLDGHQLGSLGILFPRLKPKGYYIIEDVHVTPHTVEVFDGFLKNKNLDTYWIPESERQYIINNIQSCQIYPEMIVIKKNSQS